MASGLKVVMQTYLKNGWLLKAIKPIKEKIITLDHKLKKESLQAIKDFEKLSKQAFGCGG
jgi:hypothetical protein